MKPSVVLRATALIKTLRVRAVPGLVLFGALALIAPQVHAADVDPWNDSFLLQATGFQNPLVRVGLNPCPLPPGGMLLGNPTAPEILLPAVQNMQIVFAIADDMELHIPAQGDNAPDSLGKFNFQVKDGEGFSFFDVFFDITTDSGGVPMNWSSFIPGNPIFPAGAGSPASIGFNFGLTSHSTLTFILQISDPADGTSFLSFAPAPAPPTLALLGPGLAMMIAFARRRTRR